MNIQIKSEDKIVEITPEQWNDFAGKWFYAYRGLAMLMDMYESKVLTKKQYHKTYVYYEQLQNKMISSGLFTSKYDFRTNWAIVN
jgi:hypothetical protein